jgi:hypothetical protein
MMDRERVRAWGAGWAVGVAALGVVIAAAPLRGQSCQPEWTPYALSQGFDNVPTDLMVFNNKLVARGYFTIAGSQAASRVAVWDGVMWSAMPGGSALSPGADGGGSLVEYKGALFAMGSDASTTMAGWVWDGSAWGELPATGLWQATSKYAAVAGDFDELFAAGAFQFRDPPFDIRNRTVARYRGTAAGGTWDRMGPQRGPIGSAFGGPLAITTLNGIVYVGGDFTQMDLSEDGSQMVTVNNIARWNGTTWQPMGPGFAGRVRSLAVFDGTIYAGGSFTALGDGTPMRNIARWDWAAGAWRPVGAAAGGGGVAMPVWKIATAEDGRGPCLLVTGDGALGATAFNPDGSTVDFISIVRWDGNAWSPLAGGMSAGASCMASWDNGTGLAVYMGGSISRVNGVPNSVGGRFVRWGPSPLIDTDGDGLFDVWETQGIDADCDGVIDFVLPGANPNRKDLYVEVDAMVGAGLSLDAIDDVELAFAVAPAALVQNPDGSAGITLHVEVDEQNVPASLFPNGMQDVAAIKAQRFGTAAQRASPSWAKIKEAKRRAYRYGLFGIGHSGGQSSGLAELPGNDFTVTLGLWTPAGGTRRQQAGTFMHELGHTLGLYHGGHQIDWANDARYNQKPNYRSVMNYSFQFPKAATNATWVLDYSQQVNVDLFEAALLETFPIGTGPMWHTVIGPHPMVRVESTAQVDYDRDGSINTLATVAADVNRLRPGDPATPGDVLEGSEDWSRLLFNFRNTVGYADGAPAPNTADIEMDYATYVELQTLSPPGQLCGTADFDGDGDTGTDADIEAFFACLSGNCCPTCWHLGADFNGDGDTGTDADIESFFRVLAGGEC